MLTSTPAPTLNTDQLLEDFICARSSLFAIAADHGLTLDQLIAWYRDQATQARIRALDEMAEAQKTLMAKFHSAAAIDRLAEIVEATAEVNPIERRRAASLVLKHSPTARKPKKLPEVARPPVACEPALQAAAPAAESDAPTPQSSHESALPDPTHNPNESRASHLSHQLPPSPIQSPLTHDALACDFAIARPEPARP